MSSVQRCWALVIDFLEAINRHREAFVRPSDTICVDESITQWYHLGCNWIDLRLPHYVSIDRNPERGCEIQNEACGSSGIILRVELFTTAEETAKKAFDHGTDVLHRLIESWTGKSRLICADAHFVSVETSKWLKGLGLRFTGVFKTSTRK